MEKLLVTGVAADSNTARISVIGVDDKPGIAFQIFDTLAKSHINVDIILQSVGREGTKDISFTVASEDLENALRVLEENKERLTIQKVTYNEDVAKLSIVEMCIRDRVERLQNGCDVLTTFQPKRKGKKFHRKSGINFRYLQIVSVASIA